MTYKSIFLQQKPLSGLARVEGSLFLSQIWLLRLRSGSSLRRPELERNSKAANAIERYT